MQQFLALFRAWWPVGKQRRHGSFDGRQRRPEIVRDRIAYFVGTLTTPDIADWQEIRLPVIASPLYYLVRMWRLLKKYIPAFLTPAQRMARSAK